MSVVLLDSGMGQALMKRSGVKPTPLWSARVMLDRPDLVQAVHEDNIRAGATVITVNAYSATRCRLEANGVPEHFEALQRAACDIAHRARDAVGADVRIAGCLSPLKWSYRPDQAFPIDEAAERYAEMARIQAPHIDVMPCETLSSWNEARGAALGAQAAGRPVWLSVSVDDTDGTRLRAGENVAELFAGMADLRLDAALVNCSRPEAVTQAMPELAKTGLPFGGYANGFTAIDATFTAGTTVEILSARKDLGPEAYADHAMAWVAAGARLVGGCCETEAAHIAALGARLAAAGYSLAGDFT